jgi:hypothetical protein
MFSNHCKSRNYTYVYSIMDFWLSFIFNFYSCYEIDFVCLKIIG